MSVSKMIKAGGVAIATLGLSTCTDNGAVDPAPPPFECTPSGAGGDLSASGSIQNGNIIADISYFGEAFAAWKDPPQITDLQGATLLNATFTDSSKNTFRVVLKPEQGTNTGSFHVIGTITGDGTDCPADRVFTFTVSGSSVQIALRDVMPLGSKARASIAITRREGHEVELAAAGAGVVSGATLGWSATAGAIEPAAEGRVRWTLPEVPGLYQVELLVDRGRDGVHIDTLTLEVT